MAYGQQPQNYAMDSSGPSTETAVPAVPITRNNHGPEASVLPDYSPTSNTLTSGYPMALSGSAPANGNQNSLYGGGSYSQSPPSYPQYYNTSSNLRPSGAYGSAVSSGFPRSNYSFHPQTAGATSAMCNCPQPSVVTVQDIITVQNTVTAPPLTITMTSTVSVTINITPSITPTVTITITTTVCAGAGQNSGPGPQNTGEASNVRQAATSLATGQQSGVEYPTGSDFSGPPTPVTSEPGPVNEKSPLPSAFVTGGMSPQIPMTRISSQLNQPSLTKEIGSQGTLSSLGTSTDQIPQLPETSSPAVPQPQPTSLPVETGGYGSTTSSLGEEFTYARSASIGQQTSDLYPAQSTEASSEAETIENTPNTSVPPLPLMSYGGGPASPSNYFNGHGSIASGSIGSFATPPYAYDNSTSLALRPTAYSPTYGTGSAPLPTLPAITGQAGQQSVGTNNAAPYITSSAGYISQGSGFPAPAFPIQSSSPNSGPFGNFTSLLPLPSTPIPDTGIQYQPKASPTYPYHNSILPPPPSSPVPPNPASSPPLYGNNSTVAQGSSGPLPSVSNTLPPFIPSGTGPVYSTRTEMVVPYPMTTPSDSSSTQAILPSPSLDRNLTSSCSESASNNGNFSTSNIPSMDQSPTPAPLPNASSLSPELSQPQGSSLNVPMPTSSTFQPPSAPTGAPIASSSITSLSPVPSVNPSSFTPVPSSPAPPAAGTSTTATGPSCSPTVKDATYNVDFNTLTLNQPLPMPYGPLSFSGFTVDNGSPTPHLTSSADATVKSISIGPSTDHFNLTSLSLACSIPPCNVTMIGIKAPSITEQGAAAGGIAYKTVRVEAADHGANPYTVADGFNDSGWSKLQRVNFIGKAVDGSDAPMGVALDNLMYSARTREVCGDTGIDSKLDDRRNTL
ncbi:MAG: hypothetical protein Q9202_000035 [Teloschistes flavicans]